MNQEKTKSQQQSGYMYKEEKADAQRYARAEQQTERKEFSFRFKDLDKCEEVLRKPRSQAYIEVIGTIDLLSATDEEIIARLKETIDEDVVEEFAEMTTEEILAEIKATFREEFAALEVKVESVLHGVLTKCYISGCDCHAIGPDGSFLEHYKIGGAIPSELAKGRKVLQKYPDCSCVEVYNDCCRVVNYDTTVVRIENDEI